MPISKPKKSSRILQDNAFSLDIEFYTCVHKVSIGQYMRALIKKNLLDSLATFNSTFSQTGFEKLPNHINMSEETRDWEFPLTKVTATSEKRKILNIASSSIGLFGGHPLFEKVTSDCSPLSTCAHGSFSYHLSNNMTCFIEDKGKQK